MEKIKAMIMKTIILITKKTVYNAIYIKINFRE